ncbi:MAG: cell division ATP-binding protein FtsE [Gammaproteobacteria bacterium]|nr:cell division ATP-binding protein FtsE [Gammaproteobacteria bacterium]
MIRFDQVCKRYPGGHDALSGVSFALRAGEFAFLTGHSGAGKSSLLRLIMLLERPTQGQILINGRSLGRLHRSQIPHYRRNIGVVFQNHHLLLDRSIHDNVALPLRVSGYRASDVARRVRAALDKVGLLAREHSKPLELSSGEQQRVGIARAVVHTPRILLADEPTGNLDPELSMEIMKLFSDFSDIGVTVLIATHDIGLIEAMGRRQLQLRNGRLVAGSDADAAG